MPKRTVKPGGIVITELVITIPGVDGVCDNENTTAVEVTRGTPLDLRVCNEAVVETFADGTAGLIEDDNTNGFVVTT